MTKQCELTGIKVSLGNNVSHAHNKTKRNFMPNLQRKNIYSDVLNQMVRLKISTNAIKSIECAGGFDKYIVSIPNNKLSSKALKLKKTIKKNISKSIKVEKKIPKKKQ
jgi:large subunit ribosomal protein L28